MMRRSVLSSVVNMYVEHARRAGSICLCTWWEDQGGGMAHHVAGSLIEQGKESILRGRKESILVCALTCLMMSININDYLSQHCVTFLQL